MKKLFISISIFAACAVLAQTPPGTLSGFSVSPYLGDWFDNTNASGTSTNFLSATNAAGARAAIGAISLGDLAGLTNGSAVATNYSGVLSPTNLPATVAYTPSNNNFTAAQTFSSFTAGSATFTNSLALGPFLYQYTTNALVSTNAGTADAKGNWTYLSAIPGYTNYNTAAYRKFTGGQWSTYNSAGLELYRGTNGFALGVTDTSINGAAPGPNFSIGWTFNINTGTTIFNTNAPLLNLNAYGWFTGAHVGDGSGLTGIPNAAHSTNADNASHLLPGDTSTNLTVYNLTVVGGSNVVTNGATNAVLNAPALNNATGNLNGNAAYATNANSALAAVTATNLVDPAGSPVVTYVFASAVTNLVYSTNYLFLIVSNAGTTADNLTYRWNATIGYYTNGTLQVGYESVNETGAIGQAPLSLNNCDYYESGAATQPGLGGVPNNFTGWDSLVSGSAPYPITFYPVTIIGTNIVYTYTATFRGVAPTNLPANLILTNATLLPADSQAANQVTVQGKLRVTEGIVNGNPNMKAYIAFASCLKQIQTNILTIEVLGDSLSDPGYHDAVTLQLINLLRNTYGWVGDIGWKTDQNGADGAYARPTSEQYWFSPGTIECDAPDNSGAMASYTQGFLNSGQERAYDSRIYGANQAGLFFVRQPLGGTCHWIDKTGPAYTPGTTITLNTLSNTPTLCKTNWPIPFNVYPNFHNVQLADFTITGTNVIIGGEFENTNATAGVRAVWLGGNWSGVAGSGSSSLSNYLSPGTNLLHQFSALTHPDVILYLALDYNEWGATNMAEMQRSLTTLLSPNIGLAWTNTKIFLVSRPSSTSGGDWPATDVTTNNAALRLTAEANGWSYIPLQEDFDGVTYAYNGLAVDPLNQPFGIFTDGIHPSGWGAYVMALDVLTQLHVPLKFDPNWDNCRNGFQPYGKQFMSGATNTLAATGWTNRTAFLLNATAYTTTATGCTLYTDVGNVATTFGSITSLPIEVPSGWYIIGTNITGTAVLKP